MVINVKLDSFAIMPDKAHNLDAGFDLYAPKNIIIKPGKSAVIDTGVHFEIPEGWCGLLVSKSGLNVKDNITSTGLIDSGYTGSVVVKLYNHSDERLAVMSAGRKISQIIFLPVPPVNLCLTDIIQGGERGNNGFGSSDMR